MSKTVKILLIVAACAAGLGLLLMGIGMVSGVQETIRGGFDLAERIIFSEPSSTLEPTSTITPNAPTSDDGDVAVPVPENSAAHNEVFFEDYDLPDFHKIVVDVTVADVCFFPAESAGISIRYGDDRHNPSYSVEDGVLRIQDDPYKVSWNGKSFKEILQNITSLNSLTNGGQINVYLPADGCDDISVTTVDGDIELTFAGGRAGNLSLETVNGGIVVYGGSYGKIKAGNVNGSIRIDGALAGDASLNTVNGGLDVFTTLAENEYTIEAKTLNGSVVSNGDKRGNAYNGGGGTIKIEAETVNGEIQLAFAKEG